ncbi:cytochrome P450 [Actinomadura viridis]|uniref:Cytochrome P450 n=1 Tax=Actinomadura viridis TaxID=58110 RepID=A0A931DK57_9ACTN|nr:cytochrome P450 [Actinomadura viridis]MBG6091510.1 cytochrome P450 [Actinomadura viridis]
MRPPYGGEAWLATRHAHIRAILADPRFTRFPPEGCDEARLTRTVIRDPIAGRDRDEHTRIRRFLAHVLSFNAVRLRRLRENVRAHAEAQAAQVLRQGPGTDLCGAYAEPVSLLSCYDVFGISIARQETFARWFEGFADPGMDAAEIAGRRDEVLRYLGEEVEARRRAPRDDVLTHVAEAIDAAVLGEDLLYEILLELILVCDNVAIEFMGVLYLVLADAATTAAVRRDPGVLPRVVEECLRLVPFPSEVPFARHAAADVVVGDTPVRAGDQVLLAYASGNRDAEVFADPDAIRLDRPAVPHLSFGHGPAHCLGAPLVRVIMRVALGVLLERIPAIGLAVPPERIAWRSDLLLRRPESLPVTW